MQDSFHSSRVSGAGKHPSTQRELQLAEAMGWLMRLEEQPEDVALMQQHWDWLASSPEHQSAWEHACNTWRLLQALPPTVKTPAASAPEPQVPLATVHALMPPVARWKDYSRALAGMAIAACLILVTLPSLSLFLQADYRTGIGESRQISLADGSQLYLGADSAVAEDYSGKERRIQLLKGEAFFDVVPDHTRPFVVTTGKLKVTVLGTRFNVVVGKLSESVSVASGKVAVQNQQVGQADIFAQHLLPGDQLTLANNGSFALSELAVEDVGSWRDKRLYVQDTAIADVVATLQRYHSSRIVILGGDMENQRVTGAYDLAAPDQALESLVSPYQGKVHSWLGLLRVVTH